MDSKAYNGAALAYLGDAVIELIARETVLQSGVTDVGKLNKMAAVYVRATSQSAAMAKILPLLSDEENAVYKRGRNAHGVSVPKSASAGEYRRATGMEALFAHLHMTGQRERMYELFHAAFSGAAQSEDIPNDAVPKETSAEMGPIPEDDAL